MCNFRIGLGRDNLLEKRSDGGASWRALMDPAEA
jgi:hypothetical protein